MAQRHADAPASGATIGMSLRIRASRQPSAPVLRIATGLLFLSRDTAPHQPVDKTPRMGIRPRRDGEPRSSGRMRGAFPTGWRPGSLARPVPPAFAGREDLPPPLPGGASRRVGPEPVTIVIPSSYLDRPSSFPGIGSGGGQSRRHMVAAPMRIPDDTDAGSPRRGDPGRRREAEKRTRIARVEARSRLLRRCETDSPTNL